jgi:general secretion pathway protein H
VRPSQGGFTLLELLVVVTIIAMASAGVAFAVRDASGTQLDREAQRLGALFEAARAQSRASGVPVKWRPTADGFVFEGVPPKSLPDHWLGNDVRADANTPLVLGPEPIIGRQSVLLVSISDPSRTLRLGTDGLRPFGVQTDAQAP